MHRLRPFRVLLLAGFILAAPPRAAMAASTGSVAHGSGAVAGSGATVDSDALRALRLQRADDFAKQLAANPKAEALLRERKSTYERKRAEHRADCRDQVRRANKESLIKVLLLCYREELTLEEDFLSKEREYLTAAAGVSEPVRSRMLDRLDVLADAMHTIVYAIDSGVYASQADLLEAKQNLYARYRVPFYDASAALRADRALTWVQTLILGVDAAQSGENPPRPEWNGGRACLVTSETALSGLIASRIRDRGARLADALAAARACLPTLAAVPPPPASATGSGPMQTGSGAQK